MSESHISPSITRSTHLKLSLLITSLTLILLMVCFLIDFFQSNNFRWVSLIIKLFPLALFQLAFRKQQAKTYAWFCFLLLVYFIFLMPLLNASNTWLDWIQLALVVVCFIAAMMSVRWLKQERNLSPSVSSENSNL